MPPRRDLRLEPLVEVLEGRRLVHAHAYRADEMVELMRLAERARIQDHDAPARARGLPHRRRDQRARRRRLDLLRPLGLQGRSLGGDSLQRRAADAARHRGVSINSDSAEEMRHLNQEAPRR
jgi:hypothetical protein